MLTPTTIRTILWLPATAVALGAYLIHTDPVGRAAADRLASDNIEARW